MNESQLFDLIPKSKFDDEHIEAIKALDDKDLSIIMPKLLEWIQDMNWPIASSVVSVMVARQNVSIPVIRNLLSVDNNDDAWKYWILTACQSLNPVNLRSIVSEVNRIAQQPTEGEKAEECNLIANELLDFINRSDELL